MTDFIKTASAKIKVRNRHSLSICPLPKCDARNISPHWWHRICRISFNTKNIFMHNIQIHHPGIYFRPNSSRVLIRPFIPADASRVVHIIGRALSLSEAETEEQVAAACDDFCARHVDVRSIWLRHYERVTAHVFSSRPLSETRKQYIGALFSGEYALESAALFNPSIVAHPDQSG